MQIVRISTWNHQDKFLWASDKSK